MSIGIGAYANLILQDDKTVIYEYGSFILKMITENEELFLHIIIKQVRIYY